MLTSKPSKYPYKARQNALLSIQLYEGQGPIDLKMVSNLSNESNKLFPAANLDLDAKRHGKFAAEFIHKHADGNTLIWLNKFINNMAFELAALTTNQEGK